MLSWGNDCNVLDRHHNDRNKGGDVGLATSCVVGRARVCPVDSLV